MAVDKHPSRRPSEPRKPPTAGPGGKADSGQAGVHYGARHTLHIKPPHKSEMAHHFHAARPGDEKSNDEPG